MAEKGIAQPLALARAADEAGDVDEADGRMDDPLRVADLRQDFQPLVGDRDLTDVRFDRRKRIVRGMRLGRACERIKNRRLADVGKADDAAGECHFWGTPFFPGWYNRSGEPEVPPVIRYKESTLGRRIP